MVRWSVLVAGVLAVMGLAFVAGAAVPEKTPKPPAEPVKADTGKLVIGQKTGYFNMAKVMRANKRAKASLERLNAKKDRLSANIMGLRAMYEQLQAAMTKPNTPPARKTELEGELRTVARQIEDLDRVIAKILNDRASHMIAELHDEMYATASAVARDNNLTALLAYPDAVTREERDDPHIKEMRLKPPALQPFYLDASVEFSDEIIRRLNDKFDADNE